MLSVVPKGRSSAGPILLLLLHAALQQLEHAIFAFKSGIPIFITV